MIIVCENCGKSYRLPDERIPQGSRFTLDCPKCNSKIPVVGPSEMQAAPFPEEGGVDIGQEIKKKILRGVKDLPPMPEVVYRAREIMTDPNSSFKDIAGVLETDQAITVAVLKIANSAYYGLSGKVTSVRKAAVILGIRNLAQVVTAASTSKLMARTLEGYDIESDIMWRHSLSVAFGSKIIAALARPELEPDAFCAGLIHDMGKLVLDPFIAERKDIFHEIIQKEEYDNLYAEQHTVGTDHAEISHECCQKWRFPESQSMAIRYHHDPMRAPKKDLACILYTANLITKMHGIDIGGIGMDLESARRFSIDGRVKTHLGLTNEDIDAIAAEMMRAVDNIDMGL